MLALTAGFARRRHVATMAEHERTRRFLAINGRRDFARR